MDMRVSPRRSVLASVAAGCCLAASVVAGGYAASGAMPFSEWPAGLFAGKAAAEVALAPATRAAAPVLTLPASEPAREQTTKVIPLGDAATDTTTSGQSRAPRRRTATTSPKTQSRTPKPDDVPDSSPATAPAATTTETPAATAASPAAENGPTQPQAPATTPSTRKVTLGDVSSTFASASDSQSGQPELRVQMAVADDSATAASTKTVALSLKLAPTDIQALKRNAATLGTTHIALETEVDVVDATVVTAGQPACADGQCLRVQMKFAQDTRPNPAEEPEVQLLDDGDAISNRVKVVVKVDADDLGGTPPAPQTPADPQAEPAPEAGTPSVLSLPLPPATEDPAAPSTPATDTATVALPDADPANGDPATPAVQVQAQLSVVETPAPADTPAAPEQPAADPAAAGSADCE
jgi:hypothetical protein